MTRRIYVASSWRNVLQPAIVHTLRRCGHEVYDFRHPKPEDTGFSWGDIAEGWKGWTPKEYREGLKHPIAQAGFKSDMDALKWCDTCVLVLPSGRSASWEFGWALGAGKAGAIVMFESCEPELMYSGNPILTDMNELFTWAGEPIE